MGADDTDPLTPVPSTVAPVPSTTPTILPPEEPVPPPAPIPEPEPAPAPAATVKPTSCRQSGRTVVYGGMITNVSTVPGSFAVDAVFLTRRGDRFATGTATVADVAPRQTVRWEVRVPAPGDLRNTGASCETAALRVVP